MSTLRFYFQVSSIEPISGSVYSGPHSDWTPPVYHDEIRTLERSRWYEWTPNSVTVVPHASSNNRPGILHGVTSLFWDQQAARYYGVPIDCRAQDVDSLTHASGDKLSWSRLAYGYNENDPSHMTLISFDPLYYNIVLGAPAPPHWMPQFLPETSANDPTFNAPRLSGNTVLAGPLSILVALASFSCQFNQVPAIMRQSFRPPRWIPHQQPTGRQQQRGIVAEIRREPMWSLDSFERGQRGPLIS